MTVDEHKRNIFSVIHIRSDNMYAKNIVKQCEKLYKEFQEEVTDEDFNDKKFLRKLDKISTELDITKQSIERKKEGARGTFNANEKATELILKDLDILSADLNTILEVIDDFADEIYYYDSEEED